MLLAYQVGLEAPPLVDTTKQRQGFAAQHLLSSSSRNCTHQHTAKPVELGDQQDAQPAGNVPAKIQHGP